jgi:hypothetical protein
MVSTEAKMPRPLTAEQVTEYHREGFVIARRFFDPDEIERMAKATKRRRAKAQAQARKAK